MNNRLIRTLNCRFDALEVSLAHLASSRRLTSRVGRHSQDFRRRSGGEGGGGRGTRVGGGSGGRGSGGLLVGLDNLPLSGADLQSLRQELASPEAEVF